MDEFVLLNGHNYATLLVGLEARRPVDVLPGREVETVARWLEGHPEVEIVCLDRASAYAEAARAAAPQAVQIADFWHLWNISPIDIYGPSLSRTSALANLRVPMRWPTPDPALLRAGQRTVDPLIQKPGQIEIRTPVWLV
ncbi:transposase [Streptomyces sp. NPDC059355]|uniref:transposase n=1 Tax=Streptomyces sp. NPDC059355 TaxID=3346811 RepID=UPI0036A5DA39